MSELGTGGDHAVRRVVADAINAASGGTAALVIFFAIAFVWTWGFWWIISTSGPRPPAFLVTISLLLGFGPAIAACVVIWVFDGGTGLRLWLRRCFHWRLAARWYAAAFVGPPLVMLAALVPNAALGGTWPASPANGHLGLALLQFAMVLFVGGPVGEEFGWRGYALPVIVEKLRWRWASLILGAIWALWHIPLFRMPGTAQEQMPMALFMASNVALSIIFARLSVITGFSVLPAIATHWSINAWSWVIPVSPKGDVLQPYYLVMGLLLEIAFVVFLKPDPKLQIEDLQK